MERTIYLAGPEVFLPDAREVGAQKKAICAEYSLTGLFPLDNEIQVSNGQRLSAAIFDANMAMIRSCDAIIANITPYRGISADPGTVFELATTLAMTDRMRLVLAYSNVSGTIADRVAAEPGLAPLLTGSDGRPYARDGLAVEDFGLVENLMIDEALLARGTPVVVPEQPVKDISRDLITFRACVRAMAESFKE